MYSSNSYALLDSIISMSILTHASEKDAFHIDFCKLNNLEVATFGIHRM